MKSILEYIDFDKVTKISDEEKPNNSNNYIYVYSEEITSGWTVTVIDYPSDGWGYYSSRYSSCARIYKLNLSEKEFDREWYKLPKREKSNFNNPIETMKQFKLVDCVHIPSHSEYNQFIRIANSIK